jgi:hypothetical protein
MRYTPQVLRSIDLFALLLIGVGVLYLMVGIFEVATATPPIRFISAPSQVQRKPSVMAFKISTGAFRKWMPFIMSAAFLALGVALTLGVRRVVKNDGEDVIDFANTEGTLSTEGKG